MGIAVGGYVHWCLYRHGYRFIPVIGPLFLANAVSSGVVAIVVLFGRRLVTRLAGIAVATGTLAAFVARPLPGGLFHFQARGFQPRPQSAVAVAAETAALALLVAVISGDRRQTLAGVSSRHVSGGRRA